MKTSYRVLPIAGVLLTGAFLISGCSGSASTASNDAPTTRQAASPAVPADAREVDVARKMRSRPIAYVEDLLVGEPGVLVRGRQVRIRGSQAGPLWVIDGMYTDSAGGINPHDVGRMWIVASGSGYGRRGANGVVIIASKMQ